MHAFVRECVHVTQCYVSNIHSRSFTNSMRARKLLRRMRVCVRVCARVRACEYVRVFKKSGRGS